MTTIVNHMNVQVPKKAEKDALDFYGRLLGLQRKDKPEELSRTVGAHYQIGPVELHLGVGRDDCDDHNRATERHNGFAVADLEATRTAMHEAGYAIEEAGPVRGIPRFFTRDPGGNRVEIMQSGE